MRRKALDISREQMEELRLGALTAIDGLWFMAVEKKSGFEEALELDLEVWKQYGVVIIKRLARMLGIGLDTQDPPDMATVNFVMEKICEIDGTICKGELLSPQEIRFRVHRCSWWENLNRSGREDIIPCEYIDNTIFRYWLEAIDPTMSFEITHALPRGDAHCEWTIKRT
jgi:hypothetical protein